MYYDLKPCWILVKSTDQSWNVNVGLEKKLDLKECIAVLGKELLMFINSNVTFSRYMEQLLYKIA